MTGVGIRIDTPNLDAIQARLAKLRNPQIDRLLKGLGAKVEAQTRLRIADQKTSPEGDAWKPWSEDYAKTRNSGQSLLQGEGHLLDSIQFVVGADSVEVGSNLIYAAIHQFGGEAVDMPEIVARPYLGLSSQDTQDLERVQKRWLNRLEKELR